MFTVDPKEVKTSVLHSYMLASIAPRPIALASTVDRDGKPNLSPFSFFNAFGSHPPILIFSPARRVRDNTIKHTLENIYETKEVVINVVNYAMVQQTSLSSTEFPKGVDEFLKAGFTSLPSTFVRPLRVKESPVQMECKVLEVKETGTEGGAGNLIICEILLMHIDESVLTPENKIDIHKIDLVARMGSDHYCRASGSAIFEVRKPGSKLVIGIDSIPEKIRLSKILSGNNLGQLGNVEHLPNDSELQEYRKKDFMRALASHYRGTPEIMEQKIHELAKALLDKGQVDEAWRVLLAAQ